MKREYTLMAQRTADGRWRARVWNRAGYFEPDVEVFDTDLEVLEWGQRNFGRLVTRTEIEWELVYEPKWRSCRNCGEPYDHYTWAPAQGNAKGCREGYGATGETPSQPYCSSKGFIPWP